MEAKQRSGELTVKLLWDLANALSPESHTNKLLQSYYLTACKKIARREVKLPAVKFAPSVMCPKCSSIWSQSKFSLKLKPQRIHSQKARKLVDSFNSDPKSLTKKQRARAKWLKKTISSNVEIKCEFCQKKTLQPLIKPKKTKIEEKTQETVVEVLIKKKKKKKTKDKSAGLKLEKVNPQKTKPVLKLEKVNPQKTKPVLKLEKVNQQKTKPCPQKKANKSKGQPQKGKVEKIISKTQKQNSLLQLANMLKNRGPALSSKSNNQLDKFLR